MGLRISTNVASLMAQHQLSRTSRETQKALAEMATGSRFTSADSDAAGHAISENLLAQIAGLKAAQNNTGAATSFVQTAEGSLNEQNNILIRMRELAVQAASDTYANTERGFLNMEFEQLRSELDRIAKTTTFGSTPLLSGEGRSYEFQVGVHKGSDNIITYENNTDTTTDSLGISGLTVSEVDEARNSLEDIDGALLKIGQARAQYGAIQSRLERTEDNLSVQIQNISAAQSRIADVDIADAVSRAKRGEILQQYQASVLTHSNQFANNALRLIA